MPPDSRNSKKTAAADLIDFASTKRGFISYRDGVGMHNVLWRKVAPELWSLKALPLMQVEFLWQRAPRRFAEA
jgi:hypothetical protein